MIKRALLISLIGCLLTTGLIVIFSEVHKIKETKLNDKLKIFQDSVLINNNELDSLNRLYEYKPPSAPPNAQPGNQTFTVEQLGHVVKLKYPVIYGDLSDELAGEKLIQKYPTYNQYLKKEPLEFRQLIMNLFTKYGMQLTEKKLNAIVNQYGNNELEWVQNFYKEYSNKKLTIKRLEYIRSNYINDSISEAVFQNKIKSEIEPKNRSINKIENEINNLNSELSKSYPIKSYLIIEIAFWLLIFMPILFIILKYRDNKKSTGKQ